VRIREVKLPGQYTDHDERSTLASSPATDRKLNSPTHGAWIATKPTTPQRLAQHDAILVVVGGKRASKRCLNTQ
jgi:hypothetical protein